jgi:inosine-uridine nucleoside N-ribohydrolase
VLDINLNTPEYNFQADPTRWQNIITKMPAGVRLDFVSMGDAVGVLQTGVTGWDKARLTASGASSTVPLIRALAAKVGTLTDAGERESYDGFVIADLLWPGVSGEWRSMRDVVIENDGHNTTGTTIAQQARYLAVDPGTAPAVKQALLSL